MAGEKILVIDDAKNIRDIFSMAFKEYVIVAASGAKEALDILKKPNDIELIVLDVRMPDMNGLELLNEIKKINTHCKVIIMTAYSSKDIVIEALRCHADEYLEKPFNLEDVRSIFRRLLKGNGHSDIPGVTGPEKKIKLAQRLIKKGRNNNFSLWDLSKELFLSYKYLSRLFKEKSGKSFTKYKLGLKVASAKQFLKRNSYTVSQVAYKIGYQNPNSFMKTFKKFTGFTPSQYRNRINAGFPRLTSSKQGCCGSEDKGRKLRGSAGLSLKRMKDGL